MLNRALIFVLILGTFWDFVTTYVGTVTILENLNWVAMGTGLIGAAIVCVLNFYTTRVWEKSEDNVGKKQDSNFINWIVRLFWLGAIILDFYASFVAHYRYALQGANGLGAGFVIVFITALLVISPMTLGKVWEERRKTKLAEQRLRQQ